jgi:hypothetical protein
MPRQKQEIDPNVKPSRVTVLNLRNDCIAHRLIGKSETWGGVALKFRQVLLQDGVTEEIIFAEFQKILDEFQTNLRKYRPRTGPPADLIAIEKMVSN